MKRRSVVKSHITTYIITTGSSREWKGVKNLAIEVVTFQKVDFEYAIIQILSDGNNFIRF